MRQFEARSTAAPAEQEIAAWNETYGITGLYKLPFNGDVAPVRGFVRSPFSPLIYHCVMKAAEGTAIAGSLSPERKGILLGSQFVDTVTQEETWKDLIQGKKLSPIMFPQSVPSSVIGFAAKQLRIHGPMSCMGAFRDGLSLLVQQAIDWMEDDEADAVLVVCCEVPSISAELWTKTYVGHDRSVGGGAVGFVIEPRAAVSNEGRSIVCSIAEWLRQGEDSGEDRYYGMAFGMNNQQEREAR